MFNNNLQAKISSEINFWRLETVRKYPKYYESRLKCSIFILFYFIFEVEIKSKFSWMVKVLYTTKLYSQIKFVVLNTECIYLYFSHASYYDGVSTYLI